MPRRLRSSALNASRTFAIILPSPCRHANRRRRGRTRQSLADRHAQPPKPCGVAFGSWEWSGRAAAFRAVWAGILRESGNAFKRRPVDTVALVGAGTNHPESDLEHPGTIIGRERGGGCASRNCMACEMKRRDQAKLDLSQSCVAGGSRPERTPSGAKPFSGLGCFALDAVHLQWGQEILHPAVTLDPVAAAAQDLEVLLVVESAARARDDAVDLQVA